MAISGPRFTDINPSTQGRVGDVGDTVFYVYQGVMTLYTKWGRAATNWATGGPISLDDPGPPLIFTADPRSFGYVAPTDTKGWLVWQGALTQLIKVGTGDTEWASIPSSTKGGTTSVAAGLGAPGSPGESGADGDQGPTGPSGPSGPAGSAGATGSQGPIGPPGPEGPPGDDGLQGPQGAQGATGSAGAAGSPGPAGPIVFMEAEPGEPGDPGPPGAAGTVGSQGTQGPSGPALFFLASDGEDGERGPPGATGPAGAAGGGGGSATTVEVNLGATAQWQGRFTITDGTITATSKVLCWQAPGPYTGKGTRADEATLQPVKVTSVEPATGTAVVQWETPPIYGVRKTTVDGRAFVVLGTGGLALSHVREDVTAIRLGKIRGNVKFSYLVFA